MSENTKLSFKESTLAKRSRLILFALNLALIVPFAVKHYSHWGVGGAAVLMLIAFNSIIIRPEAATAACVDIPRLLFFDVLAMLAMSWQPLFENFHLEDMDYIVADTEGGSYILLIAGLAIGIFVPKKQNISWLKALGKTLVGSGIILMFFSNGDLKKPMYFHGGKEFLMLFLMASVVWHLFCILSGWTNWERLKKNGRLTNILLWILVAMCVMERQLLQEFVDTLPLKLSVFTIHGMAWWQVIVGVFLLLGCAAAVYRYEEKNMGVDAVVLAIVAGGIFLLKVLIDNYFSFSWALFVVYLIGSVRCYRNEQEGFRTMRLITPVYLGVQLAVLLALALLLEAGLWIVCAVIAVYALIVYGQIGKIDWRNPANRWWYIALTIPAAVAIAFLWQMRYSPEGVSMILAALAVLLATMFILNRPHPEGMVVPREYKLLLCVFMVVLCLFSTNRFGAKVDVEFDYQNAMVQVEPEARGKDNQVVSVTYSWTSLTGETIVESSAMSVFGTKIPVQGEKLTVTVTDANGVVTTRTAWYPGWMLEG